jgi:glyoxylase-like metal-dependent hydrolase (beta-lactamase superfamily II)
LFRLVFGRVRQPKLVADGVVQLGTDLVNWFLVDVDGRVVVVDTGLPGYENGLDRGLALLGRSPRDVEAILLTHSHSDHSGGAEPLRRRLGAPVHVHEAEAEAVRTGTNVGKTGGSQLPYLRYPHAWRLLGHFKTAGPPPPVDDVQPFDEAAELPGGFRAVLTEGHTPGHVVLHQPSSGLLFAGDHICTTNPLTGARGPAIPPRPLNVSSERMLASLDTLEPLDASKILFGHGEPWREGSTDAVRRARATGIT